MQPKVAAIPGIQSFLDHSPRAARRRKLPDRIRRHLDRRADRDPLVRAAASDKAMATGMFAFPPLIDVKIDQPQSEVVIDRDKVAALGLNLSAGRDDLSRRWAATTSIASTSPGRSYKVIPQVKRVDRLNPDQLENIYVTGPERQLVPLSTVATIGYSTIPRSLNRFQQLNAVTISGVAGLPARRGAQVLEDEGGKILPEGLPIDYMGESRQLRRRAATPSSGR
jgi:multidrug efflux pump